MAPTKDRFKGQSLQNSCHLSRVNASVRCLSMRSCNEQNHIYVIFILVSSTFDNVQVTIKKASDFINGNGVTEISALTFLQRLEKAEKFINPRDFSWSVKCNTVLPHQCLQLYSSSRTTFLWMGGLSKSPPQSAKEVNKFENCEELNVCMTPRQHLEK